MGLFSGLEKIGLGNYKDAKLLEEKRPLSQVVKELEEKKIPEKREEDVLFDKRITCPVCDLEFKTKCVRAGKIKLEKKDTDLRPIFETCDANKYDVIACDKCGYASVSRYFGKISVRQMKDIKEQVGASFKGLEGYGDTFSYDDSILRYKLALVSSVIKKAKNSEKAYTCLKMAWVIRGKRLSLNPKDEVIKQLYDEEMECISNAYTCFVEALANETLPIAGMDENTLKYLMADLARKLKKYDESARLVSEVIVSKTTQVKLKDQALELKELLKEDIKKHGKA